MDRPSVFRPRFTRPMAGVHWTLPCCVAVLWLFDFGVQSCSEWGRQVDLVLLTSTVWIALWASSVRKPGAGGWRRVADVALGATYDLLLMFLIFFIASVAISLIAGTTNCYGPRAKVSELILHTVEPRGAIDERFAAQKTLRDVGKGLTINVDGRTKAGFVTLDGVIVAVGDDPAAVVTLAPTIVGDKLVWKCVLLPSKYAPGYCR